MEKSNLNTALTKIGIRIWANDINSKFKGQVDIEHTLLLALYEAKHDGRLLYLLFSWIEVYGDYILTEKFQKLWKKFEKFSGPNHLINAFCAFAYYCGYHKFKKLCVPLKKKTFLIGESAAAIKVSGAIDWLAKINLLHPNAHFELRPDSITPLEIVLKNNFQLRNRLLYGVNWRADIITAIQAGVENPSRIKDLLGCSYEPANRIFKQYKLAMSVGGVKV